MKTIALDIYDWLRLVGEKILATYENLINKMQSPWLFFALVILLMTFPLYFIRSYHFDESLAVGFARDLLDGGNKWYEPHLYGVRFVERPQLLGWFVGVMSWPFGEVYQSVVRLPTLVSLYAGAMLIFYLLKDYVSKPAAVFASLCFLFAPAVLTKVVTAESDLPLSITSFCAFILWWRGYRYGRNEIWRWVIIGLLLGITALFKGPQPAAFFALGIGSFLLLRRNWAAMPGYILAGFISLTMVGSWYLVIYDSGDTATWARFMRLDQNPQITSYLAEKLGYFIESNGSLFPGMLAVFGGIVGYRYLWSEKEEIDQSVPNNQNAPNNNVRELFLALLLFVAIGYIAILIWPGGKPRYLFAALPGVAAMAGIVFDRARIEFSRAMVRISVVLLLGLMVYQAVWNLVISPSFYTQFADTKIAAEQMETIIASNPAPLHVQYRTAEPALSYLRTPIYYQQLEDMPALTGSIWVLVRDENFESLMASYPEQAILDNHEIDYRRGTLNLTRLDLP